MHSFPPCLYLHTTSSHTCTHNTGPHQRWFIKLGKQNINDSLEPALFISTQTKTDRACLMPSSQTYFVYTHKHTQLKALLDRHPSKTMEKPIQQ